MTAVAKKSAAKKSAAKPKSELARRREFFANMTDEDKLKMVTEICDELAASEYGIAVLLKNADAEKNWPGLTLWNSWLDADAHLASIYARAKHSQADYMADLINKIADEDVYVPLYHNGRPVMSNGKQVVVLDRDKIQHARLRIDTRKWTMAKLAPRKYGERLQLADDPENPINPPAEKPDLSNLSTTELKQLQQLHSKLHGGGKK